MRMIPYLLTLVLATALSAPAQAATVTIKPELALTKAEVQRGDVLASWHGRAIVRGQDFPKVSNLYMITSPDANLAELSRFGKVHALDERGLAVVEVNDSDALTALAGTAHDSTGACGSIRWLSGAPLAGAKRALPAPVHSITNPGQGVAERVAAVAAEVSADAIVANIRTFVSWGSRYHQHNVGSATADRLLALYEAERPADRTDVTITPYAHQRTPQASLVVRIQGTREPNLVIVLGSHLDAINRSTSNNSTPGADDNGSGTSTNLEIFRVLMRQGIRPARTIEIHAYAAEEIGLVGSAEIARAYNGTVDVGAMVQFDMNAFKASGPDKIWLVSNETNAQLNTALGQLIDAYVGVPWELKQLWFGSSDHASWTSNGVPASFPTEDPGNFNTALHTSRDTLEVAMAATQSAAHAKTGVAFLLHYAGF